MAKRSEQAVAIVVSHTHWDRAWYLPFEKFRIRLVRLTEKLLRILRENPRFTFTFDGQTVVLEDVLQVRPEWEAELKEHISAGRILVGPWYVLPDEFLVSGEALLRNLLIGHRIAQRFGRVMKVGYIPDPFGHIAQLPQILNGFGLDTFLFMRGMGDEGEELGSEFWWVAPDGESKVLAHHQITSYCNAAHLGYVFDEDADLPFKVSEEAVAFQLGFTVRDDYPVHARLTFSDDDFAVQPQIQPHIASDFPALVNKPHLPATCHEVPLRGIGDVVAFHQQHLGFARGFHTGRNQLHFQRLTGSTKEGGDDRDARHRPRPQPDPGNAIAQRGFWLNDCPFQRTGEVDNRALGDGRVINSDNDFASAFAIRRDLRRSGGEQKSASLR